MSRNVFNECNRHDSTIFECPHFYISSVIRLTVNKRCVKPLDVPRTRVAMKDLVGDGRRWQEQGSADADREGECAHAETDLEVKQNSNDKIGQTM